LVIAVDKIQQAREHHGRKNRGMFQGHREVADMRVVLAAVGSSSTLHQQWNGKGTRPENNESKNVKGTNGG